MDLEHAYEPGNARVEPPQRKATWMMAAEDDDEFFSWPLKIDEGDGGGGGELKASRKRKLSSGFDADAKSKGIKDGHEEPPKKSPLQNGSARMPQWQVDDISDLNADIENSLNINPEMTNTTYNMSDAILSISGLTVFKQEAPSPTSHDGLHRQNHQSPTSTQGHITTTNAHLEDSNSSQNMINSTLHQLLGQQGYSTLQNAIDGNIISSSTGVGQDNYGMTPGIFSEDCRFQYVLAAATSIATKLNEDTLTYLNQGQSYEIKLKKLGDLSKYRGRMLRSIIRICFHERRLQYMEKEQMLLWQRARPGDRILEVDVPLSYGLYDVVQPTTMLNSIQFNWDPTKEVGIYIKVNCISTEFTPKKHGGEKGVPFRIQVETYQSKNGDSEVWKRVHVAACQIKVFKLKGADRKHKQDREKILKRPMSEQEKYQPSYECTVLNDVSCESLSSSPTRSFSPDSGSNNRSNASIKTQILEPIEDDKPTVQENILSLVPIDRQNEEKSAIICNTHLHLDATPKQTANWLMINRFDKYMDTFGNFCGMDLLRLSREDLIQICGNADGIRLYNALNSKTIAPKLTIYVRQESANVYNAVFLSSLNCKELRDKLAELHGVAGEQVKNVYVQGPQCIHVQLNNDFLKYVKEETLFSFDVLEESASYIFVLKPSAK